MQRNASIGRWRRERRHRHTDARCRFPLRNVFTADPKCETIQYDAGRHSPAEARNKLCEDSANSTAVVAKTTESPGGAFQGSSAPSSSPPVSAKSNVIPPSDTCSRPWSTRYLHHGGCTKDTNRGSWYTTAAVAASAVYLNSAQQTFQERFRYAKRFMHHSNKQTNTSRSSSYRQYTQSSYIVPPAAVDNI